MPPDYELLAQEHAMLLDALKQAAAALAVCGRSATTCPSEKDAIFGWCREARRIIRKCSHKPGDSTK